MINSNVIKILIYIIIGVVLFVLYVRYLEKKSLFYPTKELISDPSVIGLEYEDCRFKTKDGVELHGWLIKSNAAKTTVLFFHGNAGNLSERIDKIEMFSNIGVNTFIVSYRGYAKSEGQPTEDGVYHDAIGAFDYIKSRGDLKNTKVCAYGASLGGAVAVDLAAKRNVDCLIVDSTFSNAVDMAKKIYPFIPSFMINIKLDSTSKIRNIKVPLLMMHSKEDLTVPYHLGQKLFNQANEPKSFVDLKGGHNDAHIIDRNVFMSAIESFLTKHNL